MSGDDKSILDEIRSSLIRDGLGWSVEPEKKLIYLWNKNVRTEEELRKTSNEVHQLRRGMKDEMTSVQSRFTKIKELSEEKQQAITKYLTEENEKLHNKVRELTTENEALLQERTEIENLYSSEEVDQISGGNSKQPFQVLLQERERLVEKAGKSQEDVKQLTEEVANVRLELDEAKKLKNSVQEELAECQASLEMERSKMETIRDDHTKQRKLHRKQIHDLREKLSQFESTKNFKGEDNSNMSHQLKDAISEVSLLSSELNKSTEIAEETDRLNLILNDELSRAVMQNEELSRQIDQLIGDMTNEREKSIEVLEEQLQKQHEVESILDSTQQELTAQVRNVKTLTEDLEKEHELCEEFQSRVQVLEQSLHQKHAVSLEKELLQQSMSEHERNIETLESERNALEAANQDLTKKSSLCETRVRRHLSTIEELSKKLSEALAAKEGLNREKVHLQEEVLSLQQDKSTLGESLDGTNNRLDIVMASMKNLKKQHEDQKDAMESQLSLLQKEKDNLLNLLEEESARQDKVRDSLNMTVSQIQDELHSKCEELNRARLETQKAMRDTTSLQQSLDNEVVFKQWSDHKLESLQQEKDSLQKENEALSNQLKLETKSKETQLLAAQTLLSAEKNSLLEEKNLEVGRLRSEFESATREAERKMAALTAKLDATCEVYQKRTEAMQHAIESGHAEIINLKSKLEAQDASLTSALRTSEELLAEKVSLEHKLNALQKDFDAANVQFSAAKVGLEEKKALLENELNSQKRETKLFTAEQDAEKTNLQAQIATLKSQKNSMEQEVKALETSLDAEKSQCESLKEDISEKMGEVEAVKELLDKTKEELTEMSSKAEESAINLQVLASSWKECKTALAAKEKEIEEVQTDKEGLEGSLEEMECALHSKENEVEVLESQLTEKESAISDAEKALENKEQSLREAILQLVELDMLWSKTQTALEKEQAERIRLVQDTRKADNQRNKHLEHAEELVQERDNLRSKLRSLEFENTKLLSTSRRTGSKLAKKMKELSEAQAEKKKTEGKAAQLEQELSVLQSKTLLVNKSPSHMASETLQEELKLHGLMKDQTISNLERKLARMEGNQAELEATLKDKEEVVYQSEVVSRERKLKVQRMADKMEGLLNEKESLEDTVSLLKEQAVQYRATIIKLQGKLDNFKIKYDDRKKRSKDRLASTWSQYSRKRLDLESSLDGMKDQLKSVKKELDFEYQWRDTSDGIHHKILQEKSELVAKLAQAEEELREKRQRVMELEMRLGRMQQENAMLEERNKALVNHIRIFTSSPDIHERSASSRTNSSAGCLHSLLASPINATFSGGSPSCSPHLLNHSLLSPTTRLTPLTSIRFTLPTSPPPYHTHSTSPTPSSSSPVSTPPPQTGKIMTSVPSSK